MGFKFLKALTMSSLYLCVIVRMWKNVLISYLYITVPLINWSWSTLLTYFMLSSIFNPNLICSSLAFIALSVNCSNFFENATGILELFTKQPQLLQTHIFSFTWIFLIKVRKLRIDRLKLLHFYLNFVLAV